MIVEVLNEDLRTDYEAFLLEHPNTLIYVSDKYRRLLKKHLKADDYYLIAFDKQKKIIGALPSFVKRSQQYGNIINSLPFYGSNGGIVEFKGNTDVRNCLLEAFSDIAKKEKCVSSTIITSPFEESIEFYNKHIHYSFKDERIGQILSFPDMPGLLSGDLMNLFHSKTRNMVRKAINSHIGVEIDNSLYSMKFLIKTHIDNINKIGGIPKEESFFYDLADIFSPGSDYNIWVARYSDQPVAALLLLYFNKTVEYFTPVIVEEFRSFQPLSLLIYEAMQDAIRKDYKWWNFGGTWLTQQSVYHFKKRWGSADRPYYYYNRIIDKKIEMLSPEVIKSEYPFFYVLPFNRTLK